MRRGLVVGKFAPPHVGHSLLVERALAGCDELHVAVIDNVVSGFDVSAQQRALWLAEIHPQATVTVWPDIMHDDRSDLWADYTRLTLGYTPDVVFTSEQYGDTWAKELQCEHVCVDMQRLQQPVSATQVRGNPLEWLQMLHPVVRAHYVPRVSIMGAESTGTTTLATDLGTAYGEPVVPEYGRMRDEQAVTPPAWTTDEFMHTAITQRSMEDRMARAATNMLFCDTDPLATALWHERYLGYIDQQLLEFAGGFKYMLSIVTDPDGVPAEQDGYRFEMHRRPQMHQAFIRELRRLNRPFIVVTGDRQQRIEQARAGIEQYC